MSLQVDLNQEKYQIPSIDCGLIFQDVSSLSNDFTAYQECNSLLTSSFQRSCGSSFHCFSRDDKTDHHLKQEDMNIARHAFKPNVEDVQFSFPAFFSETRNMQHDTRHTSIPFTSPRCPSSSYNSELDCFVAYDLSLIHI